MKKIIISIEDGIVIGVYSDIMEAIDVTIIDADDYYDDSRKHQYLQTEAQIENGIKSGTLTDLLK